VILRRSGIFRGALVLGAVLALLGAVAVDAGAAKTKKQTKATTTPAFCANPVDNYRGPLEKLQKMPALPLGGVTRFAPAGLTISPTGPQGLLIGASSIGFRLTNSAPTATRTLNWTVLERLTRLTKNGQDLHPEGLKRINLKAVPAAAHRGLVFPLPATTAVYSLEITIQNHRGKPLGRYGEYVRVVSRVANAGLSLAGYENLPPGGTLEACFENHGTASVLPGAYTLERLDGTTWKTVNTPVTYALATRWLGAGEAERLGIAIPPAAKPGLYKVTVGGTTELGEPFVLAAEFGVL
jgi:hypothetical protein